MISLTCLFFFFSEPPLKSSCLTVVQCPELSHPEWGSMSCSDPLGPSSYQSTCVFQCEEGYELSGSDTLSCGAEGNWDASQPSCVGKIHISIFLPWRKNYIYTVKLDTVLFCSSCPVSRIAGARGCHCDLWRRCQYDV